MTNNMGIQDNIRQPEIKPCYNQGIKRRPIRLCLKHKTPNLTDSGFVL